MLDSLGRPALVTALLLNGLIVAAFIAEAVLPLATLAVVAPLGVALTRRPQRGLLVLAALVPFDGLLLLVPDLPALAAGWKEALVLSTLAATFVAPASARAATRRPLPGWAPAVAGLLVLGLISAFVVGGFQAAWGLKIAFFFVLVPVIVWRCPLDATERDALVTILFVAGLLTAIYGLAQQVIGHTRLHALGYEYNSTLRFTGRFLRSFSTFDNPFGFAYFLMLVLLIGVPHALERPDRLRNRLFILTLPLLVAALASTFVRGAWIGLFVGLAYLGWVRFPRLLLGLPLVLVGLLLLPTGVAAAALSSNSGAARVASWEANLMAMAAHPLGVGLGSSNAAAEKTAKATGDSGEIFRPDNEYYRAAYELGALGVWFLVLLLVSAFLGLRALSSILPPDGSLFALAASSTVLAAAAASFVTTYFDTFPNNVYFWLLLGVVAAETPRPVARVVAPAWRT
jgi:putative inorganic carbon (HCO3(-)) transporter